MDWFEEGSSGKEVDVAALLDNKAYDRLLHMVQSGALLSLSVTSDGGALGITITVDGKWRREYFRDADQLELWTEESLAPVVEAADLARASRARDRASRGRKGR